MSYTSAAATMADTAVPASEPGSIEEVPTERPDSPSPSVSPSLALDAIPKLDRSASTPASSNSSTLSGRSRQSRLSDGAASVVKRRGYMRPQGTSFADSARNRDSVMSLGSIAHMQYYFARTGLLDGKGAQLARGDKDQQRKKTSTYNKENVEPTTPGIEEYSTSTLNFFDGNSYAISDSGVDHSVVDSPTEVSLEGFFPSKESPPMLPPTVSTYKQKPSYTEPLPDMPVLRRELTEALQDACKVLEESQNKHKESLEKGETRQESDGFYEIEGLHMLDIITLAIRAARNYYQAHTNPFRLYSLRSDRKLRSDLYQVLDILKRMAARNFKGGMRLMELAGILEWIEGIDKLLKQEEAIELAEQAERESYAWREGDWEGREREREWMFLKSFDQHDSPLPQWPEPASDEQLPTDFLKALQDGQRLIKLHNALVKGSKRTFGEIPKWHTDVAKPYRRAENLRYWIKAAELRWEVKLDVPVMDVVGGLTSEGWQKFDTAILTWCRQVRDDLIEEWRQEKREESRREKKLPELKIEPTPESDESEAEAPIRQSSETDGSTFDPAALRIGNDEAQGISGLQPVDVTSA